MQAGFPADGSLELPDLSQHSNLVAEVFRKEPGLYDRLKERRTKLGTRLARCIKSAVDVPHSGDACLFAGDEDCFDTFSEIFDVVISRLHGLLPAGDVVCPSPPRRTSKSASRADTGRVDPKRLDPTGHTIHSVEVSAVRNLRGFRFPAAMDAAERAEVEMLVAKAIRGLAPAVTGVYFPLRQSTSYMPRLGGMDEFEEARLQAAGLHFGLPEDAAALASGSFDNWPHGRGVFASADRDLAVWTNRQEHLTIVSVATGDGLGKAYRKLVRALDGLGQIIQRGKPGADEAFATSERLGFLTSDLHRLGAALHASVLLKLPRLAAMEASHPSSAAGSWRSWAGLRRVKVEAVSTLASGKEVEGYFRISNMDVFNATDEEILSSLEEVAFRLVVAEQQITTLTADSDQLFPILTSVLSAAEARGESRTSLLSVFSGVMTASGTDGEELTQEMLAAMMREATPQDASRPGHVEEEELGSLKDRVRLAMYSKLEDGSLDQALQEAADTAGAQHFSDLPPPPPPLDACDDGDIASQSKVGSFAAALASALINHMLMFGMCCSYGMIIFSEERNAAHRALGVKMCLAASFIGSFLLFPDEAEGEGKALAVEDGEVLFWTEEQWWKMTNEHPLMMQEISKAVMRQQGEHHFHRDPEKRRRGSELSLEFIDTDRLMRREVSPSEVETVGGDDENSDEEELVKVSFPSETPEESNLTLCSPINLGETFEREELQKLPQLQTRIMEMHFAKALGEQGFFRNALLPEVSSDDYLPDLPKMLIDDLRLAYYTFAEKGDQSGDLQGKVVLPASRVIDALLYVGIFHILAEEVNKKDLTLEEFLRLGRECHLARLRPEQMAKIEELCRSHEHEVHGQMQLLVADVSHMLKMLLGIYLDFAINDAVSAAWGQETFPDTHVTHQQFAGIVSFYVKRRERDWKLLQGVFDLMGTETLSGSLDQELLEECRARRSEDTDGDATPHEEMLWAADWIRRGEGRGLHLDTCSLLTVFLTNLQRGKGRLPPKSAMSEEEVRPKRAWDRLLHSAMKKKGTLATQSLVSNIDVSKKMLVDQPQSTFGDSPAWAQTIIDLCERPQTSIAAGIVVYTLLAWTVLSVVAIIVEPMVSGLDEDQSENDRLFWLGCDMFFAGIFTIEILLRIVARCALQPGWRTLFNFFSQPLNILDAIAVMEIYFDHLLHQPVLRLFILERFARLARVMRLCKFKQYGCPMVAPLTAVLVVIMGTYLLNLEGIIE
ncbi:CKMT2 [Symbiodinium sp. CCMP2456]|nr:CKMT2 [Symbiodinium sp. CCMP2456]